MNCLNCERYLKEAIDSVYAQTYTDWEIIFWDNASTDSSAKIAKSYDESLRYFRGEETIPLGEARNLVIKKATGRYIAFLDCDDVYMPEKLEKQVELMGSGDYALCYGGAVIIDKFGKVIRLAPVKYTSGHIFGDLLERYEINMQSVMIRRAVLESAKLSFPIDYQFGPDYDLFMEIASQYSICVLNDLIVKTRLHSGGLTRKTYHRVHHELGSTLSRIVERNPLIAVKYAKELKGAFAKIEFYKSVNYINEGNFKKARKVVLSIINVRWEYFVLYVILFVPIPKSILMRLLRR